MDDTDPVEKLRAMELAYYLPPGWTREWGRFGGRYVFRRGNTRLEVPIGDDLERDPQTRRRVLLLAETQLHGEDEANR